MSEYINKLNESSEIRVYTNPMTNMVDVYCTINGSHSIESCISKPIQHGLAIEPFIRLRNEEAQILANSLWDAGIRPTGAAGSAGQLTAVQYHLEDMRKLVFGKEQGK